MDRSYLECTRQFGEVPRDRRPSGGSKSRSLTSKSRAVPGIPALAGTAASSCFAVFIVACSNPTADTAVDDEVHVTQAASAGFRVEQQEVNAEAARAAIGATKHLVSLDAAKNSFRVLTDSHGAAQPLWKVDGAGRVTWACLSAPPDEWRKADALYVGEHLLPYQLRPKRRHAGTDGRVESYEYDGYRVVIHGSLTKGRYSDAEVCAPGAECGGC